MPKFTYIAQDSGGRTVRGEASAADESELHRRLGEEGLFLISSKPVSARRRQRALKANVLSEFNRQLSQLTGAGVSLVRAMNIIIQQESVKPAEKAIYDDVMRLVRQGSSLSDAMEQQNAFPPLMVSMYRAAESSGGLDITAERLAGHYNSEYRLSQKIKSSTAYPKVLLAVIVMALTTILLFVVPQFQGIFDQMPTLPAATRFLIALKDLVKEQYILLLAAVIFIAIFLNLIGKIPAAVYFRDMILLKLPLIGRLEKTVFTARFARALSSMYSSGIPIVTALQISRSTIGNSYIDAQFDALIAEVRTGENLSTAIEHVDGFMKKLPSSIRVGEETGALDKMLSTTAEALEYDSENAMAKMVSYLEPALIILMGALVGFVIMAVILPVFDFYSAIEQGAYM